MDVLYFLKSRTTFIRQFYDIAQRHSWNASEKSKMAKNHLSRRTATKIVAANPRILKNGWRPTNPFTY